MLLPQLRLSWLCKERNAQLLLYFPFFPSHYLVFLLMAAWQELTQLFRCVFQSKNCVVQFFCKLSLGSAFSASEVPSQAPLFLLSPLLWLHPKAKVELGCAESAGTALTSASSWNQICPKQRSGEMSSSLSSPAAARAGSSSQL